MPKKIYDIKPPKIVRKIEKELKEVLIDKKSKKPQGRRKKEKRSIRRPVLVTVLVVVVLVAVYLFFKLPRVDISIWPKVDILSFKQTITADKSADLVDLNEAVIPVQYFQTTKTNSQDFPATGNATNEGQASGLITVYNKYDPVMPFTFKAGTRFLSNSGKLFVAPEKIIIPAAKKVGSKITPGSVQVKVKAAEGGSDYNIAPADFSIPGLKGTAYYYSVFAKSDSPMTGGYSGKVKKVTADDISLAKDVLTKKTASDALSDLKKQIPADYVLLEKAVLSNVTGASTKTKAGTVVENFNYQVTVSASGLAFKKSDLDQFAKDYIISKMPEGKTLQENNFILDYSTGTIDVSGGKAILNLDFSSGIYQNIDKNSMTLSMLGENANQIKATIDNNLGDQVSKVEINFWPFWVKAAPNSQKEINIELKFQ